MKQAELLKKVELAGMARRFVDKALQFEGPEWLAAHARIDGLLRPVPPEDNHLLTLCLQWLVDRFPESTNADALALREFVEAQKGC